MSAIRSLALLLAAHVVLTACAGPGTGRDATQGSRPSASAQPVRLHVAAKRFLCASEAGYLTALSPASVQSLRLQGGPMSAEEVNGFAAEPFNESALRLRRWDDLAKVTGLRTPGFDHYRVAIAAALGR